MRKSDIYYDHDNFAFSTFTSGHHIRFTRCTCLLLANLFHITSLMKEYNIGHQYKKPFHYLHAHR